MLFVLSFRAFFCKRTTVATTLFAGYGLVYSVSCICHSDDDNYNNDSQLHKFIDVFLELCVYSHIVEARPDSGLP